MDFSGRYIFLRYNPDNFIDKYNISKKPSFRKRIDILENNIEQHIDRIGHGLNTDLVEISFLFYTIFYFG